MQCSAHGGSISLESTPGEGSAFTVVTDRPRSAQGECPVKILIAEDEPSLRENLQWMLELEGFEVLAACDGLEALAMAQTRQAGPGAHRCDDARARWIRAGQGAAREPRAARHSHHHADRAGGPDATPAPA